MNIATVDSLLRAAASTVEEEIFSALPSAYMKSQATAVVTLLELVLGRIEERCAPLREENEEMKRALREIAGLLGDSHRERRLRDEISASLSAAPVGPGDDNVRLKTALIGVIQSLAVPGLPPTVEVEAVRLVRRQLRAQLDRELARPHRMRSGRLGKGVQAT